MNAENNEQILTQDCQKKIEAAGSICAMLMIHQVLKLDDAYNVLLTNYPRIMNRPLFDKIVEILNKSSAITGIKNGYMYQTLSVMEATLKYEMSSGEIIETPLGVKKTMREIVEIIKN